MFALPRFQIVGLALAATVVLLPEAASARTPKRQSIRTTLIRRSVTSPRKSTTQYRIYVRSGLCYRGGSFVQLPAPLKTRSFDEGKKALQSWEQQLSQQSCKQYRMSMSEGSVACTGDLSAKVESRRVKFSRFECAREVSCPVTVAEYSRFQSGGSNAMPDRCRQMFRQYARGARATASR